MSLVIEHLNFLVMMMTWTSLVAQMIQNLPVMQDTQVQSDLNHSFPYNLNLYVPCLLSYTQLKKQYCVKTYCLKSLSHVQFFEAL